MFLIISSRGFHIHYLRSRLPFEFLRIELCRKSFLFQYHFQSSWILFTLYVGMIWRSQPLQLFCASPLLHPRGFLLAGLRNPIYRAQQTLRYSTHVINSFSRVRTSEQSGQWPSIAQRFIYASSSAIEVTMIRLDISKMPQNQSISK